MGVDTYPRPNINLTMLVKDASGGHNAIFNSVGLPQTGSHADSLPGHIAPHHEVSE